MVIAVDTTRRRRRFILAATLICIAIPAIFEIDTVARTLGFDTSLGTNLRRSLAVSNSYLSTHSTLLPWAHHFMAGVEDLPEPFEETVLFWHIPKSGGSTAKSVYQCMGRTLANRVGVDPKYGYADTEEIVVFEPSKGLDWKTVNVDVLSSSGIARAKRMGLVQARVTDMIFVMDVFATGSELFDENNKGRIMALFRHPVDRLVSKFYYLRQATWEETYRPEWRDITFEEWAYNEASDDEGDFNMLVRRLNGKDFGEPLSEKDLVIAKEFVRQRVVVGLMKQMEESLRRFNTVMGLDEDTDERVKWCMDEYFRKKNEDGSSASKTNSNRHPKVEKTSEVWKYLAEKNELDILLFNYIVKLFDEQREVIDSYHAAMVDEGYNDAGLSASGRSGGFSFQRLEVGQDGSSSTQSGGEYGNTTISDGESLSQETEPEPKKTYARQSSPQSYPPREEQVQEELPQPQLATGPRPPGELFQKQHAQAKQHHHSPKSEPEERPPERRLVEPVAAADSAPKSSYNDADRGAELTAKLERLNSELSKLAAGSDSEVWGDVGGGW